MARVKAVLFDLDGTLVDSAPDLAGTANDMRAMRNLPALHYSHLRLHAGSGARGMLGAALAMVPGHVGYAAVRDEFLALYEARMLRQTVAFSGTEALISGLAVRCVPWGIVTNKSLHLAAPLTRALGCLPVTGVLVGGDSTPHTKPHPAPLLEAARQLGLAPVDCVYVGDDPRDVQAGRAAGMATLAAAWGYLGPGAPVEAWGADGVLHGHDELLQWLDMA
jgi:phosphoglycolate phosphatase